MIQAFLLILAGIGFESALVALEQSIPVRVYFAPSFTAALLSTVPALILPTGLLLALASLAKKPAFDWSHTDSIGGLRWVAFSAVAALCWSHAAYPFNYYYDQAHALDRFLLVLLMLATLRSPLVIPLFVFEMIISRGQLRHGISSLTPIGDELPIRLLGIIAAAALWNAAIASPRLATLWKHTRFSRDRLPRLRATTPAIVFAILCLVGSYYGFAGVAKLRIGDGMLDWVRDSHMENLLIGAYLNGWQWIGNVASALAHADTLRGLSPLLAFTTVAVECGMILLLVHRLGTIFLVISVLFMHLGIVAVSGIFFWKWLLIDVVLAVWLFAIRDDESIATLYSPTKALGSVLIIVATMLAFGTNEFTWWNTRWYSMLEVQAIDADGRHTRVAADDFAPYMLIDYMHPPGSKADTFGFGSTRNQEFAQRIEATDPQTLHSFLQQRRAENRTSENEQVPRYVDDFMLRYFQNRNRRLADAQAGDTFKHQQLPFIVSAPLLHLRAPHGIEHYDDSSPVVEVNIYHREMFYTGSNLVQLDEILLHTVKIPGAVEH